jgi:hypothetical protein
LHAVQQRCPLFEGGKLREAMDTHGATREPNHVSSTTSHALLRLDEERVIELSIRSDAQALVLVDGNARRPVSDIAWLDRTGSP